MIWGGRHQSDGSPLSRPRDLGHSWGSEVDELALGGYGDAGVEAEAGREGVEGVVGAVGLVVGEQDVAGAGPLGQAHRVVRRRVAERRLGGDLVR